MSDLKITVLVENTVGVTSGVLSEWGLGMLLDFGDEKILFDTGEQGSIIPNSRSLNIELTQVNKVVLSHGHYDHTGGLLGFLKIKGKTPVYAHPEVFTEHYGQGFNGNGERFIGVPHRIEQLESAGAEFNWHKDPMELKPGLWLSGEIERQTDFERVDERLHRHKDGQMIQDSIPDDLSLFYVTDKGLIIILGCAHSGLINIIEQAKRITGQSKVRAIIGGTHLGPASPDQQKRTIDYLKGLNLECLAPNHCTGMPMVTRLAQEFPDQFKWANTGNSLEF